MKKKTTSGKIQNFGKIRSKDFSGKRSFDFPRRIFQRKHDRPMF